MTPPPNPRRAASNGSAKTKPAAAEPAAATWRMPAEWEPHEATWIAWPHNTRDWPGKIAPIPWVYGEIVRKLLGSARGVGEHVNILVNDAAHEDRAWGVLTKWDVDVRRVRFHRVPSDRGWARDFGPIFVSNRPPEAGAQRIARGHKHTHGADEDEYCFHSEAAAGKTGLAVAGFGFNAWAKYANHKQDALIAETLAGQLGKPFRRVEHAGRHVVLEGGAIDVNGRGTLLTTEECLLDPVTQVRNPGFTREDYEAVLSKALGARNVIWLGKGIAGDDTHGHVDDLARFVNPSTIVICTEKNGHDINHAPLAENRERLQDARLENGKRPTIIELPMPAAMTFDGMRLPASYANFYIGNAAVLVPTFNDPADRVALGILAELFPEREVVGIHAVDLVWGLGTLHCLTQQQPV